MKTKDEVSINFLRSLESELCKIKIDSVTSIGQLVCTSLYQGIYCGDYLDESLLKKIKLKLNLALFNYRNRRPKFDNFNYFKNIDGLITFSFDRDDLIYLDSIVARHFIDHQKKIQAIFFDNAIIKSKTIKSTLDMNGLGILNISDILSFYNPKLLEKYNHQIKLAENILVKSLKDYNIYNDFLADNLRLDLRTQIFHYCSWLKFLKTIKPSFTMVESDRNNLSSPIIMASKKLKIPSFSLMHGNVQFDFVYVPILADKLLVWGDYQKELLIKLGANEDQIKVVGAPQFSKNIHSKKTGALNELSIQDDKRIIVLATSNYKNISYRLKLIRIFAEALKVLSKDNWHGIIKMHPGDDLGLYKDYSNCEYLTIFTSDKISKETSFEIAEYFCFFSSAIAFEALLKQKKLILIKVDNEDIGECELFIKKEAVPVVINSNQLIKTISDGYSVKMQNKIETFSKNYYFAMGEEALENVYSEVQKHVKMSKT